MTMPGMPDRTFDDAYIGVPPWDIGRPQRVITDLLEAGAFRGSVIDVGCGTGENALALAAAGLDVLGIDSSPRAIGKAMDKARERGIREVDFLVVDVFEVGRLGRTFEGALDCGLFHVLDDHERPVYAAALHAALDPGGMLTLLCFSDRVPPGPGPRRVGEQELRSTFAEGWRVDEIAEAAFETTFDDRPRVDAWLARIVRA